MSRPALAVVSLVKVALFSLAVGILASTAPHALGQSLYAVRKSQVTYQTSGTINGSSFSFTASAPPSGSYILTAQTPVAATLGLPTGGSIAIPRAVGGGDGFVLVQSFGAQSSLNATFPSGSYTLTSPGAPALTLNLSGDSYPTSAPGVLHTNWSNGLLAVPPGQNFSISIAGNSAYASASVGARMAVRIVGLSDGVNLKNEIWNRAVPGFPATPTGFNSFAIPAGTLTSNRLYAGEVVWDMATVLDTTTVPNATLLASYGRILRFYIVARATSDPAPAAPAIVSQPANREGAPGSSVTLPLTYTGEGALVLWFINGERIAIDGTKYALTESGGLVVNSLNAADAGRYFAHVINPGGFVASAAATLSVVTPAATAPVITSQPVSVTVGQGSTAVFSVQASGATGYQWRSGGAAVPGGNGATLVLSNVTAAQAGAYLVVISNSVGSVTTAPATLTVATDASNPGRLANLSILTPLAVGEAMTLGVVIGGAGASGAKPLLARAAGPSLAPLGVSGVLPDPSMTLNFTSPSPSVIVATNNDWAGAAALSTAFASVGAFAYVSPESKDAAIFEPALAPGSYTVRVADAGAGSGTVIAELYDATPAAAFSAATPRLVNVSVLKQIGGGSLLTAGFVVGGATAKTVLIRAVGPTLGIAPFNIAGAMPDPQLTLVSTSVSPSVTVATNNDWAGSTAIAEAAARVGAFAVTDSASKDSMLLLTLAPGSYTAQVSPAAGSAGGTAIVEIYEVP